MNHIKKLSVFTAFLFIFVSSTYSGSYDEVFIQQLNRSHILFNSLRLSGSIVLFTSVPYFLIDDSTAGVYENAAYMVFSPGLILSSLSYGSWLRQDIKYFYRHPLTDPLINYHNALRIMKNEMDYGKVLASTGVNSFLLVIGVLMINWGDAQSADWKEQLIYSTGLGLTIQSSLLLSVDITEIISRLSRKEKVHKSWIRLNI